MSPELLRLIKLYQLAVEEMFPKLAKYLGIELPISNIDWTDVDINQKGETDDGIKYFIHGYGVAMNNGKT